MEKLHKVKDAWNYMLKFIPHSDIPSVISTCKSAYNATSEFHLNRGKYLHVSPQNLIADRNADGLIFYLKHGFQCVKNDLLQSQTSQSLPSIQWVAKTRTYTYYEEYFTMNDDIDPTICDECSAESLTEGFRKEMIKELVLHGTVKLVKKIWNHLTPDQQKNVKMLATKHKKISLISEFIGGKLNLTNLKTLIKAGANNKPMRDKIDSYAGDFKKLFTLLKYASLYYNVDIVTYIATVASLWELSAEQIQQLYTYCTTPFKYQINYNTRMSWVQRSKNTIKRFIQGFRIRLSLLCECLCNEQFSLNSDNYTDLLMFVSDMFDNYFPRSIANDIRNDMRDFVIKLRPLISREVIKQSFNQNRNRLLHCYNIIPHPAIEFLGLISVPSKLFPENEMELSDEDNTDYGGYFLSQYYKILNNQAPAQHINGQQEQLILSLFGIEPTSYKLYILTKFYTTAGRQDHRDYFKRHLNNSYQEIQYPYKTIRKCKTIEAFFYLFFTKQIPVDKRYLDWLQEQDDPETKSILEAIKQMDTIAPLSKYLSSEELN